MPRPKDGKLSCRKAASICGRLFMGQKRKQILREMDITIASFEYVRNVLWKMGAVERTSPYLPEALDQEIRRLVRTPGVTNQQIMRQLGLSGTANVMARRKSYHDELRSKGEPVPLCRCSEEFQHPQRCGFKGNAAKPFSDGETAEAIKDLEAGVSLEEMVPRYGVSMPAVRRLVRTLKPNQLKKRAKVQSARRIAARRCNHRVSFDGLHERLVAAIPAATPSDIRADVLSEMYLGVINGDLTEQQAVGRVRSFVAKAYRSVSDRFAMPSLDAERNGLRFGDMIEDERAFNEFSALDELELAD